MESIRKDKYIKSRYSSLYLICIIAISITACSEPYNFSPDINVDGIVVDGLITDQPGVYQVRLHKASSYGNASNIAVQKANVSITDDAGNVYLLTEYKDIPGLYQTDLYEFTGIPGHSYTLHISTFEGDAYQSTPQLLLPNQRIDSVYGEKSFENILDVDADGNYISYKSEGIITYLDLKNRFDGNQNYRLMNSIYLQYMYQNPAPFSPPMYGWTKYIPPIPGDGMDLINNLEDYSSAEFKKLKFSFIPFSSAIYNLDPIASIGKTALLINQFRMNDETNEYYKDIDKQLRAEGRLFDPISTQLIGNITCLNDPNKQAFGFFEASSKISYVYTDESYIWVEKPILKFRAIDLDNIPSSGASAYTPPSFWIY